MLMGKDSYNRLHIRTYTFTRRTYTSIGTSSDDTAWYASCALDLAGGRCGTSFHSVFYGDVPCVE